MEKLLHFFFLQSNSLEAYRVGSEAPCGTSLLQPFYCLNYIICQLLSASKVGELMLKAVRNDEMFLSYFHYYSSVAERGKSFSIAANRTSKPRAHLHHL